MADTPEEIQKAKKTYIAVFIALLVGTIVTVLVATYPPFDIGRHGFDAADCILGLCIVTIKASLVAYVFMHLNHEKKTVYWIIISSVATVISLAALTALAMNDPIVDKFFH